jgi:hypothetical protein
METIAQNFKKLLITKSNLFTYFLCYTIPFLVAQPQILTGSIVNAIIFASAERRMDKKSLYPILILPSLGAVTHGMLFGPQTFFLFYFLPFIWLGNYIQISIFSLTKKQKYPVRIAAAATAKCLLLFIVANIYFQMNIVPNLFVTSMGFIQLTTALIGGILAYFILQFIKKHD